MGFAICFTAGYLMSFASLKLIFKLVEGNPAPFVFLYTSGNLLSLLSSTFLSGPKRQCKNMFDEKRRTTSIIYLSTLGTSIVVCFIPLPALAKMGVLVLLLLVQMCASLWYTLSYVPYGRATAKRMLRSFLSGEEWAFVSTKNNKNNNTTTTTAIQSSDVQFTFIGNIAGDEHNLCKIIHKIDEHWSPTPKLNFYTHGRLRFEQ